MAAVDDEERARLLAAAAAGAAGASGAAVGTMHRTAAVTGTVTGSGTGRRGLPRWMVAGAAVGVGLVVVIAWAASASPLPTPKAATPTHVTSTTIPPRTPPRGSKPPAPTPTPTNAASNTNENANTTSRDERRRACSPAALALARASLTPSALALKEADCGSGYDWRAAAAKSASSRRWNVVLVGQRFDSTIVDWSGCPNEGKCVNAPNCRIHASRHAGTETVRSADVVVFFQGDWDDVPSMSVPRKPSLTRVLYYREALFRNPSLQFQRKHVDFEMGVHYHSGVLNPGFLRAPADLLSGTVRPFPHIDFIPPLERPFFAMSVISDCGAPSLRQAYLRHLSAYLGPKRVRQYGKCGTLTLPKKPLHNAALTVAQHLFYFAFENTIQDGYVTEKLFTALNMPVLPVYMGALNAPNITTTPSFIRAADFASPKALAEYLVFLADNPAEYMRYHAWRTAENPFEASYLEKLKRQMPGPDELHAYREQGYDKFPRTAACCRLCDPDYVAWARDQRVLSRDLVAPPLNEGAIDHVFFGGTLHRPLPRPSAAVGDGDRDDGWGSFGRPSSPGRWSGT